MNIVRFKLGTHVLLVVSSILLSSFAVAASVNWINPVSEKPAYVILALRDIQNTKKQMEQQEKSRDLNIARTAD